MPSDSTPVHLTDVEGIVTGTQAAPLSVASVGLSFAQLPHVHKFGLVRSVSTAFTSVREGLSAGTLYSYPGAAVELEVVSAGADTAVITVEGLDDNYDAVTGAATLNGTTPATVSGGAQFRRIFRAYVTGSTPIANTVTIRTISAGQTHGVIMADYQQSNIASYTIPNGFSGTLPGAQSGFGRNEDAEVVPVVRAPGGVFRAKHVTFTGEGGVSVDWTDGGVDGLNNFTAGTDIEFRAKSRTATVDATVSFVITLKAV